MSSEAKRETPINILPYFLCVALCVCIFCVIQSYILFLMIGQTLVHFAVGRIY